MRATDQQTDPLLVKIDRLKRLCAESYAALPERFRQPALDFELCPEGPSPLRLVGSAELEAVPPDESKPLCEVLEFRQRATSPQRHNLH